MDVDLPIKAAIQSRCEDLCDALTRRNFPLVGLLYLDDAVLHPQDANDIVGREKIVAYWRRFRGVELQFETAAVRVLSESCIQELGRLKLVPTSGEEIRSNVRYLSIWQKAESQWQIERSMFNRMEPAKLGVGALADGASGPVQPAAYVPRVK